jgi:hypothetical protein
MFSFLFLFHLQLKAVIKWHKKENMAKDRKVIPDPIDDRKFQE